MESSITFINLTFPKDRILFIQVPKEIEEVKIVDYNFAGTWLMEKQSSKLNSWKTRITKGQYIVLGRANKVLDPKHLSSFGFQDPSEHIALLII